MISRNDGNLQIITPVSCVRFDGNSSYLSGNNDCLTFGKSYSISIDFKYLDIGSPSKIYWTLIAKNNSGMGYLDNYHIGIISSSLHRGRLWCRMGSGATFEDPTTYASADIADTEYISDGKRHTVTMVYNHDEKWLKLYRDENLINDDNGQIGPTYVPSHNVDWEVRIGEWIAYNDHFNGWIYNVKFWSGCALNSDEVKQVYNGLTPQRDYLVAHYNFTDREGTTTNNLNPNYDIPFTLTDGAYWDNTTIPCLCGQWDENDWGLSIQVLLCPWEYNHIFSHVIPGAVRELYNILGTPEYIDTTYSSSNTLILEPISGYKISGIRERRMIGVKTMSDSFFDNKVFSVKIDGNRLGIGNE